MQGQCSRSDRESYTRRRAVLGLGLVTVKSLVGCVGTEDSGESEVYQYANSDIQRRVVQEVDTREDLRLSPPSHLLDFLTDESIPEEFKDIQLEAWMSLPEHYSKEDIGEQLQATVFQDNKLFENDWSMDGVAQTFPDGSKGPAFDNPFTVRGGHNPVPTRYHNRKGVTHDLESGQYLGFTPEEGDQSGLYGDENGDGSIIQLVTNYDDAEFYRPISTSDLNPEEMHLFLWVDHMLTESGKTRDLDEAFELIAEVFDQNIPRDAFYAAEPVFGDFGYIEYPDESDGINLHIIKGNEIEYESVVDSQRVTEVADYNSIPDMIQNAVDYAGIVESISGKAGIGFSGGTGYCQYSEDAQRLVSLILHETYGHGVAHIPPSPPNADVMHPVSGETALQMGKDYTDFLDEEWERVVAFSNSSNMRPRSLPEWREYFEAEFDYDAFVDESQHYERDPPRSSRLCRVCGVDES